MLRRTRTGWATGVTLLVALTGACSAEPDARDSSAPVSTTASASPAPAEAPTPAPIDVAALPLGAPTTVAHLAGGTLTWHGRTVRTDFPADTLYLRILGAVDGRPVLTGLQGDGPDSGDRFWTIDAAGHARRLGGTYQSYTYVPQLVEATGHLWVHDENRTTPRTIWELDARTGAELAAYTHNRVPHGLAPADQALVDAWVARRRVVPDTSARTRDGSLLARTRSVSLAANSFADAVVVRRTTDRVAVARFSFVSKDVGGVDRVVFEDADHVLVLTNVSYTRRDGPQQAIVRCSIAAGTCERVTDVGGNMALGVVRPAFIRRGS